MKQYDKAEKYYLKARNSKELYWGATEKLARIYGLQGKWEDAEREYKVLIKRDPDNINLKEALAYIYAMEGNFDFALNDYSNLLNSNPDSQELNENYLIILISAGKNEDALDFLLTFEEKFPDNSNLQTYHSKLEQIKDTEETGEQDSDDINEKDISESVFTETSLEDLNLN
ncbi:MAG: tetratricopeptide repeat protein [Treponema sp.]|nr:tetratricopeptide repeat protein [Treponema sp.]